MIKSHLASTPNSGISNIKIPCFAVLILDKVCFPLTVGEGARAHDGFGFGCPCARGGSCSGLALLSSRPTFPFVFQGESPPAAAGRDGEPSASSRTEEPREQPRKPEGKRRDNAVAPPCVMRRWDGSPPVRYAAAHLSLPLGHWWGIVP